MVSSTSLLLLLVGVMGAVTAAPQHAPQHAPRATLGDVRFLLWTRSNSGDEDYQVVKEGDLTSLGPFNGADPTVVLVHGFSARGDHGWPLDGKTELLAHGSYNVISVEWSKLAAAPWYPTAVDFVPQVGALTASLLDWLHEAAGMDASGVQAVGHSLGAHLAGAIGQNLKTFRLPFLTGMDPAGPEFHHQSESGRIDKSDAEFVQIIHSNGGGILEGCVGMEEASGHVDFYPNGGEHQPGCTIGGDWMDLLVGGCSHGKCYKYWMESIRGQLPFVSRPCQDWETYTSDGCNTCGQGCLEMGFHVNRSLEGQYFLATNRQEPYAQGGAVRAL
ncbi:inactive pancreatic lipase-related protein 1-like [Eriocheir sinensis]|uniref:inactive pancreatic lipase-related protein 1-like n=1 Tax=Eriocheir sinensis TaxID=95602 RepID=UPI0021C7CEBD|nr:inactive pancreatic lipase-related protein 1-like [Eriocheir sinensis]